MSCLECTDCPDIGLIDICSTAQQSVNLTYNSETWTLANKWKFNDWAQLTCQTNTTETLDPLGTYTANKISLGLTNNIQGFYSNYLLGNIAVAGNYYTFSTYFKYGSGTGCRYVQISAPYLSFEPPASAFFAVFDLQLGVITYAQNVSPFIESAPNGWYRIGITSLCIANGEASNSFFFSTTSGSPKNPSFLGTVNDYVYGWGAQIDIGLIPKNYVKTTSGPVTISVGPTPFFTTPNAQITIIITDVTLDIKHDFTITTDSSGSIVLPPLASYGLQGIFSPNRTYEIRAYPYYSPNISLTPQGGELPLTCPPSHTSAESCFSFQFQYLNNY